MSELYAELNVFLDHMHVGSSVDGFGFSLEVPTGRFPLLVQRNGDEIGRVTIIFDAELMDEAFEEELYEPLDEVSAEGALLLAGDAARVIWERNPRPTAESVVVDPTGANVVTVPVERGTLAEVGWWYGGDEDSPGQGIVALDIFWDPELDPVDANAPVRNMTAVIQDFFDAHGPPSLRSEEE